MMKLIARKAQGKLSQFIGTVLIVMVFIFSMLYIKLFTAADDILHASFSFKEKSVELSCKSILSAMLASDYLKGSNDYLNTIRCDNLGESYIPYNETYCIDAEAGDLVEGDYDESLVPYAVIANFYVVPGIVMVPDCGAYNRTLVLLEKDGKIAYIGDNSTFVGSIYDAIESCEASIDCDVVDDVCSDLSKELDDFTIHLIEANYTSNKKLECERSLYEFDEPLEFVMSNEGCDIKFKSYAYSGLYEPYPYTQLDENLTAVSAPSVIQSPKLKECVEGSYGLCGPGIRVNQNNYAFNSKIAVLSQGLKVFGMSAIGGVVKKIPSLSDVALRDATFCSQDILSVEQVGKSVRKGILGAKAYIMWGRGAV